jgi:hypothetical protein
VLDQGTYVAGLFSPKAGKLTAAALEKLGVDDELARVEDDAAPSGTSSTGPQSPGPAKVLPVLAIPVQEAVQRLADWKTDVAAVVHPGLKKLLERQLKEAADQLASDDWKDIHKKFVSVEQGLVDARKAPKILADLRRIAPVAQARNDDRAQTIFSDAQTAYDDGDLLTAAMKIAGFEERFGHDPYTHATAGMGKAAVNRTPGKPETPEDIAAQAGSLGRAYEQTKRELERKLDKVDSDRKKYVTLVDETDATRKFLKQAATKGLKEKLTALEALAPGAARKAAVEKAIVLVQEYLTELNARVAHDRLTLDYRRMLQHIHGELKKLHH